MSRTVRWLAVVGWAAVIFVFSAQPDLRVSPLADLETIVRKAGHMAAFGLLALLLFGALETSFRRADRDRPGSLVWSCAWAATVLYAISDELHQSLTPGRHPAASDVAIDAAGALLFLACLAGWRRHRTAR